MRPCICLLALPSRYLTRGRPKPASRIEIFSSGYPQLSFPEIVSSTSSRARTKVTMTALAPNSAAAICAFMINLRSALSFCRFFFSATVATYPVTFRPARLPRTFNFFSTRSWPRRALPSALVMGGAGSAGHIRSLLRLASRALG